MWTPDEDKRVESAEIARLTEEYLARGGRIQVLPSKYVSPPSKKWIAESGRDYTPWDYICAEYETPTFFRWFGLGDGNFLLHYIPPKQG